MRRYHFPLQSVSRLRAHRELQARESFAAAVQAYARAEGELAHARARIAALETALFQGRHERFCAADEAFSLAAYRRECDAGMAAEQAVNAARAEMNQHREAYLEAHRDLEVLHRLERSSRTAYRAAVAREEQSGLDDLASIRAARRQTVSV